MSHPTIGDRLARYMSNARPFHSFSVRDIPSGDYSARALYWRRMKVAAWREMERLDFGKVDGLRDDGPEYLAAEADYERAKREQRSNLASMKLALIGGVAA